MKLTESFIKRKSGHFDLSCIVNLTLANCEITELADSLVNCASVEELDLCDNKIRSWTGLEQLPNLRVLRLARNQMKELDKDIVFPALEELYLMNNGIMVMDYSKLAMMCPGLKKLNMIEKKNKHQFNACTSSNTYFEDVRKAFPNLIMLDDEIIKLKQLAKDPIEDIEDAISNMNVNQVSSDWNALDWTLPSVDSTKFNEKYNSFQGIPK